MQSLIKRGLLLPWPAHLQPVHRGIANDIHAVTKLPTQRLPRKRSLSELADLEEGECEYIDKRPSPVADIEARIEASKKKLIWRTPHYANKAIWFSKLRLFAPERSNVDFVVKMQKPWNWNFKDFLSERRKKQVLLQGMLQSFIVDRHTILGNDLATAHFLVHRGALVKFTKSPAYVRRDVNMEYPLPDRYDPTYLVEELICDNMDIYYEGFENIRRLHSLKRISLQNVKTMDDWCMDRLCGNEFNNLEVLNVSGTSISANGLVALTKLPSLRLLVVDNPKRSTVFELTLLALQDTMPDLVVRDSVTGEIF